MKIWAKLNRWLGKGFENDTTCTVCGKKGNVACFDCRDAVVQICGSCLQVGVVSIYSEIIKHVNTPRELGATIIEDSRKALFEDAAASRPATS